MKIPAGVFLCSLLSLGTAGFAQAIQPDFGPNVTVFDPSIPSSTIQSALDAVSQTQVLPDSQFDTARHA